jgi:hypothetical protein
MPCSFDLSFIISFSSYNTLGSLADTNQEPFLVLIISIFRRYIMFCNNFLILNKKQKISLIFSKNYISTNY